MGPEFYIIIAVIFIAVFCRTVFGFGDAMLAMPVLSYSCGTSLATPLMALTGFTIAALLLFVERKAVLFRPVYKLVIASAIGIPGGIFLLTNAHEGFVRTVLALLIISFSLYRLTGKRWSFNLPRWSAWIFGLVAGVFGGAYNTNGPPVIIFGTVSGWDPKQFRASLQAYFLLTGVFILAGHSLGGLWTGKVLHHYLWSLPVILAAFITGKTVRRMFSPERFFTLVYLVLLLLGLGLLADGLFVSGLR